MSVVCFSSTLFKEILQANKDAESLSNLYAENADVIHYDNVQHVGRESIRQHFEKQLSKQGHHTFYLKL